MQAHAGYIIRHEPFVSPSGANQSFRQDAGAHMDARTHALVRLRFGHSPTRWPAREHAMRALVSYDRIDAPPDRRAGCRGSSSPGGGRDRGGRRSTASSVARRGRIPVKPDATLFGFASSALSQASLLPTRVPPHVSVAWHETVPRRLVGHAPRCLATERGSGPSFAAGQDDALARRVKTPGSVAHPVSLPPCTYVRTYTKCTYLSTSRFDFSLREGPFLALCRGSTSMPRFLFLVTGSVMPWSCFLCLCVMAAKSPRVGLFGIAFLRARIAVVTEMCSARRRPSGVQATSKRYLRRRKEQRPGALFF